MAISLAPLLLRSTPGCMKLNGLPTNPRPGFSEKKHGSLWKIVNDNRSNKGPQKSAKNEEPPLIDRRQAILLAGLSWATSAMASPTPNSNPNSSDGTEKTLQGAPLTFNVGRQGKKKGDEDKEEVLTVSVRVPRGEACGFNAFINLPDAQSYTPISRPQFAGTFFNMPNRLPEKPFRDTQLRIGIGDIIKELDLSKDPKLLVTIVPKLGSLQTPIVVKDVTVNLE